MTMSKKKQEELLSKEEDIIAKLLEMDADKTPETEVKLERLGIQIHLKALTDKQLERLREEYTVRIKTRNGEERELQRDYNIGLIRKASLKPNWGDAKLTDKFKTDADGVIKKLLLPGEIVNLALLITDLSGFDANFEEIKN